MAANYNNTVETARMQIVADSIAAKTLGAATGGGSAGKLVIGTSALSGATGVLVTFTLSNPAGTVSGTPPVLTLTPPATANASAAGTAAKAELRTSADVMICDGLTVGTSASDVILNSTTIASSQPVTISSATITHP